MEKQISTMEDPIYLFCGCFVWLLQDIICKMHIEFVETTDGNCMSKTHTHQQNIFVYKQFDNEFLHIICFWLKQSSVTKWNNALEINFAVQSQYGFFMFSCCKACGRGWK